MNPGDWGTIGPGELSVTRPPRDPCRSSLRRDNESSGVPSQYSPTTSRWLRDHHEVGGTVKRHHPRVGMASSSCQTVPRFVGVSVLPRIIHRLES